MELSFILNPNRRLAIIGTLEIIAQELVTG